MPSEYLETVLADVVTRTSLTKADLTVLVATAVEWASQRLGCVHFEEPAEPIAIDGFRVVVHAGEAEYDYRLDAEGIIRLCGGAIDISEDDSEDDETPEEFTS